MAVLMKRWIQAKVSCRHTIEPRFSDGSKPRDGAAVSKKEPMRDGCRGMLFRRIKARSVRSCGFAERAFYHST